MQGPSTFETIIVASDVVSAGSTIFMPSWSVDASSAAGAAEPLTLRVVADNDHFRRRPNAAAAASSAAGGRRARDGRGRERAPAQPGRHSGVADVQGLCDTSARIARRKR